MAAGNRPLSPHLQVYRPQISSVLSIMHRISGVFLALGIFVLAYWLNALAGGAAAYADVHTTGRASVTKYIYHRIECCGGTCYIEDTSISLN